MAAPLSSGGRTCIICGGHVASPFLTIRGIPVHCNLLWPEASGARSAPRGDLELVSCPECGHVFNASFDPGLMEYTQAYENSLHFSPRFQGYAVDLADRLIRRYAVRSKTVIDIGCGKGEFLALLCEKGGNKGFGFDPSFVPENLPPSQADRLTIIRDFYSERYSSYGGDLFICRHVIEHIEHPPVFVRSISRAVASRPDAILFFEVPNVLYTLRDLGIWDLIYEHRSYFSPPSLARLCADGGFEVLESGELYGGQFLGVDLCRSRPGQSADRSSGDEISSLASRFATRYRDKMEHWETVLGNFARQGKRLVVWGGGSKGVTFLNIVPGAETIRHVVDVNPRKKGMYVSGTGQEIVQPGALRQIQPDVVVIMNRLYEEEIRAGLRELRLDAEILVA
jgi:SAM-dependent methyltransferase